MPRYRHELPQMGGDVFVTDGGLETTLIFHDGFDLPEFAAFPLLQDGTGRDALRRYYRAYADVCRQQRVGFILESATWRASQSWGDKLGFSADELAAFNRQAIELLAEIRRDYDADIPHIVISGCIGPRGDGYSADEHVTAAKSEAYHRTQIETLASTEVDMVAAFTMPHVDEAVGIVKAAQAAGLPSVIGFTVETDGRLPAGTDMREAIERVDATTDGGPAYYMVNCAHPSHFQANLQDQPWAARIRALRANASAKSHAELDEATELDDGNPEELSAQYLDLTRHLKNLNVLGGCCGTDHRHMAHICRSFSERG